MLKKDIQQSNLLQQQEKFDAFVEEFNHDRPHQALDMRCPADIHQKSHRPYTGLPDVNYPDHDRALLVSSCGRVCVGKQKVHITKALRNQPVGLKEVDYGIWQVDFMEYTLGFFDENGDKFTPSDDPFGLQLDKWI